MIEKKQMNGDAGQLASPQGSRPRVYACAREGAQ